MIDILEIFHAEKSCGLGARLGISCFLFCFLLHPGPNPGPDRARQRLIPPPPYAAKTAFFVVLPPLDEVAGRVDRALRGACSHALSRAGVDAHQQSGMGRVLHQLRNPLDGTGEQGKCRVCFSGFSRQAEIPAIAGALPALPAAGRPCPASIAPFAPLFCRARRSCKACGPADSSFLQALCL